jgi:hypothetical protein
MALRPYVEPQPHVPVAAQPRKLADEDAVIAIRGVSIGSADGDIHMAHPPAVRKGDRLSKRDQIVRDFPDAFVQVVAPGRTRANSVKAKFDNVEIRKDPATGQYIAESDPVLVNQFGQYKRFTVWYAGTWVPRPDDLRHADQFEEIQ